MTTYEMLKQTIELKIQRGAITEAFVASTKTKIALFKKAGKLDDEQVAELLAMLEA